MCTYEDIQAFHTMQACMIFKYTIAIQPFVFNISLSIIWILHSSIYNLYSIYNYIIKYFN